MGLAASQARFLGLTARKSNVEYQAQQINQQRVALSNEVMGLYGEYNELKVPVPPAVQDFQNVKYTLGSTHEQYELENFSRINSGEYKDFYNVTLSWEEEVGKASIYTSNNSVITVEKKDDTTNGAFSYLNFSLGLDSYEYYENDPEKSTITKITGDYEKYQGLATIMQAQGLEGGTYYMYMNNGTAFYTSEDDLLSTSYGTVEGKDTYIGAYAFDYQRGEKITKTTNAIGALTQESSGRLDTIQIVSCDDIPELMNNTYALSAGNEEDKLGYEGAMNEYHYQKDLYEREVEKINQKTKELQEQDRALELQLNQLDTEQKAISTEMESVSKVLQDTMDKVFKTFSG